MTRATKLTKARRAVEKIRAPLEPRHSQAVGVVSGVSRNDAGQIMRVAVTLPNGTVVSNLDGGGRYGLGTGARVRLDGTGATNATDWKITEVIDPAVGTAGTGTDEIVSTPVHAFIESAIITAFAASALISVEFGFFLIPEQWRHNQSIAYEVEVRDATTLGNAYRVTTGNARRIAGALKTTINDSSTVELEVETNARNPYTEFDATNGIVGAEDELIRYATMERETGYIELKTLTRGYASTTAAGHTAGADVTLRGISVPIPNLEQDTVYECRARAVNANGNASNWSNWESFTTVGGVEAAGERTINLITNGAFDSDVTGWALGGVHAATLAHDPAVGLRAPGSAVIEEDGAAFPTSPQLYQDGIAVTPGNEYRALLFATVDGDIEAVDQFVLEIEFDNANALYASPIVFGDEMGTLGNGKWIAFEARGVAPYGATSVTVRFNSVLTRGTGETSRVYVDDVRLIELPQTKDALSEEALMVGGGAMVTGILSNAASLNFGSLTNGGAAQELTITVTGAASGDSAIANPVAGIEAGLYWNAYVSAADTVTVRLQYHLTGGAAALDPAARNWRATVLKF